MVISCFTKKQMYQKQRIVRPLQEDDIPYIVRYWNNLSENRLLKMGLDPSKAPKQEDVVQRLENCITNASDEIVYLILILNEMPVGYALLKDFTPDGIATIHIHTWDFTISQRRDRMILFCMAAVRFYDSINIKKIMANTYKNNKLANVFLKQMGFPFIRTFFGALTPFSLHRENNQYFVDRSVAENYLKENM
jgi:hypothetical protein